MALFMAKKGKIDKMIPDNRANIEMALIEVARSGKIYPSAKKLGVCHTTLERAWRKLSEEERAVYRRKAQDVADLVVEHLVTTEVNNINTINDKLLHIAGMAMEELQERLDSPAMRRSIKDADLINIIAKSIQLINESTKLKTEDDKPERITNIFQIFDNSIQDNIQQNHYNYGKDTD